MSSSLHQWAIEQLSALKVPVSRLVTDSRSVRQGDTFVAYPGERIDGRQFIAQAIAQGANAVIYESQYFVWDDAWQAPNLAVADLRHKAGWLADAVYGTPSEKLWMVGITGTNGKTSTSHWIAQALNDAAKKCALIGTLGNGFVGELQASANTTPDAIRVQGLLADYVHDGADAVAMEVSSHALSQGRVNAVRFNVAILTNLSRDHLDYHGDMQSYAAAKRKLFDWDQLGFAVLNLDDAYGAELAEQLSLQDAAAEIIGYGLTDSALQLAERLGLRMVYGNLLEMTGQGLRLAVHSSWGTSELNSALVGRFNAANLLGALAVLLVSDIGLSDAVQSLGNVQAAAGRMQRLGGVQQPTVVVDYAHTPDALEKVLQALREACLDKTTSHLTNPAKDAGQVIGYEPVETVSASSGGNTREGYAGGYPEASPPPSRRLICVFGCGGDRDRGKRAMMGKVAEKYSDFCIVTSDNPRGENPREIIADIVGGMNADNHEIIEDRATAIQSAIRHARQSDTVLIAGKGHEDYQEINGIKYPFSDVSVVQQALQDYHNEVSS
jgi:UDP-N-acetylmuramoyl-L-alanyl-D-glutamate--2,6-diaminopimelate ligase